MYYIKREELVGVASRVNNEIDLAKFASRYVDLTPEVEGAATLIGVSPFPVKIGNERGRFIVVTSGDSFDYWTDASFGESGDAVAFVQRIESLSYEEAVKLLANHLGVPLADNGAEK